MSRFRVETDSMGEVRVPQDAYYGAQTQRAVENFRISGWRFGRGFIAALGLIKWAAAQANEELGLLEPGVAAAIRRAADEVVAGDLDAHFVVDVFQTGSGTSTNMNANEVIANRANELLGRERGSKTPVHPNDHVNRCQSSNDVIPTAAHLAALTAMTGDLKPACEALKGALQTKAIEFNQLLKPGRTHLMDATPVLLGQEFAGYASQISHGIARIDRCIPHLSEVALGGTAVGTGINAHPRFAALALEHIARRTGLAVTEAPNHFEAQGARDAMVEASGALKTLAVSMSRIAEDLRIMASGPRTGLGEIRLPALQPGSSIMPGKVNPVMPEVVLQACAQVVGNDAAITLGGLGSRLELNTMMPLMIYNLLVSIDLLAATARSFDEMCIRGIQADPAHAREAVSRSLVTVTALVPALGYDTAAEISREAHETGRTLREVVLARKLMSAAEFDRAMDLMSMAAGTPEGRAPGEAG